MATRKFYDGFETYTAGQDIPSTNGWVQDGARPLGTVQSSGDIGPKAGSNMARFNYVPGDFENVVKSFASLYTNECFFRMWFMLDANFTHDYSTGSGIHCMRMLSGTNDILQASPSSGAWLSDLVINNDRPSGSPDYLPGTPSSSAWHKFELYIKLSTTTACKSWYDGTLELNTSGFSWNSWKPDEFFLASNYPSCPDSLNYLYIDEFEFFSDASDGEAVTGSMDDASIQVAAAASTRIGSVGGLG